MNDSSALARTVTDDEVFGLGAKMDVPSGVTFEEPADDDHWEKLKDCHDQILSLAEFVKAHRGDVLPRMDLTKVRSEVAKELLRLPADVLRGPPPPAGGPVGALAGEALGEIRGSAFDTVYQLLTLAADVALETLTKRHSGNGEPMTAESRPISANGQEDR